MNDPEGGGGLCVGRVVKDEDKDLCKMVDVCRAGDYMA